MSASDVILAGPLPDPVHGQSVATLHVLELLRAHGLVVRAVDTGGDKGQRWRRIARHIKTAAILVSDSAPHFYAAVNSEGGMILTVGLAAIARLAGKTITLHHHSYRYIANPRATMRLLMRVAGPDALHLTQSDGISADLRAAYAPYVRLSSGFSNVGAVPDAGPAGGAVPGKLRLGHLSNLSSEKGVGRAIDAFRHVLGQGVDATLTVAGPRHDAFAEQAVAAAAAEFGDRFAYLGPVHGADKDRFFAGIDMFLFPSLYPDETQGIVNLEALAAGVPVVAIARGCIADDLGEEGGAAIPEEADYSAAVAAQVARFCADPAAARLRARHRYDTLRAEHLAQQAALVARLSSKARAD